MTGPQPITPQTKVAELLNAYPHLEDVLVDLAPAFEKLKNPVLRRTVARLTTLEKAAGIAGLDVRTLVRHLRRAAGQSADGVGDSDDLVGDAVPIIGTTPPEWFDGDRVRETLDADELLSKGEVPLPTVLSRARDLSQEDLLRVTVSFAPVPLVEALQKQGHRTFVRERDPGSFELYISVGQ